MSTFGGMVSQRPGGSIAPTDHNVAQAGNDGVSTLTWSPTANILVSGNWDSGIRCWEVQEQNGQIMAAPKAQGRGSKRGRGDAGRATGCVERFVGARTLSDSGRSTSVRRLSCLECLTQYLFVFAQC